MTFLKIYKKVNFVSYKGNKIFQNDFFIILHFFKKNSILVNLVRVYIH